MARPDEVPSWFWSTTRHPRLTLRLAAPPGQVLEVITAQLRRRGFRIRDLTDAGCRATHLDWWGLAGNPFEWDRTVLEVSVRPRADGLPADTELELRVASGRYGPAGRRRTVKAVRATVDTAAARGWAVSWSEWTEQDAPTGPDGSS